MSTWIFPTWPVLRGSSWLLIGLLLPNQTIVSNVTARGTRACIMISSSFVTKELPLTPVKARFPARFPPTFAAVDHFRNAMARTCPTRVGNEDKLLKELEFLRGSRATQQASRRGN